MMVGLLHHLLGHERGRAHPLKTRHGPGPLERPVHHRSVELHHAIRVRQPAISDARVFRIQLDNVYPATTASSTSAPSVIMLNARATQVRPSASFDLFPFAADTTTGLEL